DGDNRCTEGANDLASQLARSYWQPDACNVEDPARNRLVIGCACDEAPTLPNAAVTRQAHGRTPQLEAQKAGVWIAVGIGVGGAIGTATHSMAIWICIGAIVGTAIGVMGRRGVSKP